MFGLYVTHPQIVVDPETPVPKWHLSERGRARVELAAASIWASSLTRVISSDETKAIETAEIIGRSAGLSLEIFEHMGENDRSATGFLVPDKFEAAADWFFAHPDRSFHGWERAVDAQSRIVTAVLGILADHDPSRPLAFIGHGGVGTLLKCHLAGLPIERRHDQPAGGGNLYAFSLSDRVLLSDWLPMETADAIASIANGSTC